MDSNLFLWICINFYVCAPLQPFSIISRLRSALDSLCFAFAHVQQPLVLNLLCAHSSQFMFVHGKVQAQRKPTEDVTTAAETTKLKPKPTLLSEHVCVRVCVLCFPLHLRAVWQGWQNSILSSIILNVAYFWSAKVAGPRNVRQPLPNRYLLSLTGWQH